MSDEDATWRVVMVDPFDGKRESIDVSVAEAFIGGWSAHAEYRDEVFTCDHRGEDAGRVVAGVADKIAYRFELSLREVVPPDDRASDVNSRFHETIAALYAHAQGDCVSLERLDAAMRHGAEIEEMRLAAISKSWR